MNTSSKNSTSSMPVYEFNPVHGFGHDHGSKIPSCVPTGLQAPPEDPSLSSNSDDDSPFPSTDFSSHLFKYISDILMEEDMEDKPCMVQDSLALEAAERSFYEVLGEEYPSSSDQTPPCFTQNAESLEENFPPASSIDSCNSSFAASDYLDESNCSCGQDDFTSSLLRSSHFHSPGSSFLAADLYGEKQFSGHFNVTAENTNKSLLHSYSVNLALMNQPPGLEEEPGVHNVGKCDGYDMSDPLIRRKSRENGYLEEGRSSKQSGGSTEESEQLEMIDNEFLHRVERNEFIPCPLYDPSRNEASKKFQQNEQIQAFSMRIRRQFNSNETVDLLTLLIHCAQAVGSNDQRTANELLKQISQHSSPFGDGNQRLAHYFANGLEARLAGTGNFICQPIVGRSTTAADILKAYQLYASICPFRKMTNRFSNRTIAKAAGKATNFHIIDFGVYYGFQWPCFFHRLSTRRGGPPKIRMTGIDLPEPGFRPAERVEESGRRLKRLAERLGIPFEYNAIAQKWETIRYEDLKIKEDEFVAVNCMYRLGNLPDEATVPHSPRDCILKLIKKINPDIFMHGVVNGAYNAPFFVTRFREALFHFSAMFDMFEACARREDPERLLFEREMIGRDAMNVIACEGLQRFSRPETYRQWQGRSTRIGFRQLPLYQDVMKAVKELKSNYHKDFIIDENGAWMLLGWKGRIVQAISAWKPIQK